MLWKSIPENLMVKELFKTTYRISADSFRPWIASTLKWFLQHLLHKSKVILQKLYENIYIFQLQKTIVQKKALNIYRGIFKPFQNGNSLITKTHNQKGCKLPLNICSALHHKETAATPLRRYLFLKITSWKGGSFLKKKIP